MHKKIEINELDIPRDDIDCWERYPKHRWVYDVSRVLDSQNIKWSPFKTNELENIIANMYLESADSVAYAPGWIYISNPIGKQILSEVYIIKGEIKHIRYTDNITKAQLTDNVGDVELRISAFVTMHFQKFTGVISVETIGNDIYSIRLKAISDLSLTIDANIAKLVKRIYKKNDLVHISGLSDHTLQESYAS